MAPAADVAIRVAQPADFEAIGRLGALLVQLHHDWDAERFIVATPQTARGYGAYLASQLKNPEIVMLVADVGGVVVGYTYAGVEDADYMSLRGPAGVIYDLIVEPAQRAQGVGLRLLRATMAALEARGAPRFVLSTAEQNEGAQRLFARAGFRRTMVEMTRELD